MLKGEWGEESNGKLPTYSIPGKTAALVPEFSVEDLPIYIQSVNDIDCQKNSSER